MKSIFHTLQLHHFIVTAQRELPLWNSGTKFGCYKIEFFFSAQKTLLQFVQETRKQRKISLDEMFSYYTNNQTDPALDDCDLLAKLEENKKLDCEYETLEDYSNEHYWRCESWRSECR